MPQNVPECLPTKIFGRVGSDSWHIGERFEGFDRMLLRSFLCSLIPFRCPHFEIIAGSRYALCLSLFCRYHIGSLENLHPKRKTHVEPYCLNLPQSRAQGQLILDHPSQPKKIPHGKSWNFLSQALIEVDGRRLVVDPFSKTEVAFEVEDGRLTTKFNRKNKILSLSDIHWICLAEDAWYLQGNFAYSLPDDLLVDWIRKDGVVLSAEELEELREDCEDFEVRLTEAGSAPKTPKITLQPRLQLQDARGVSATFTILYPDGTLVDPSASWWFQA